MRFLIPKGRLGLFTRAFVAAFVVIACAAGATAVAGLLQVKQLATDFSATPALKKTGVSIPPPGAPQTLLLIGADRRIGQSTTTAGNTDTMMLVRLNDSSSTINLLSIPRDLQVNINGSTEKLNAAYSEGGPHELIRIIRQQVFPGFKVNHIMVVSFLEFAHLINDIGCVYSAVDQRYYNHNDLTGDATDFSNIDLFPGYQKLCGQAGGPKSALAFVRYRHTDTDEVRNARQQDFLRWAKDQFTADDLLNRYTSLAKDFGKNVQTDGLLHTTDGLINLFNVLFHADGHQVKTIQFPEGFDNTSGGDYVVPTSTAAEHAAYRKFMTPTVSKPKVKKPKKKKHHAHHKHHFKLGPGLTLDTKDGQTQANELGDPGIPIYYPKYIPDTYGYCFTVSGNCDEGFEPASAYNNSYPRRYVMQGPGKHRYKAWVMTLLWDANININQGLSSGLYFNVQGLQWKNPPLLRKPTKTEMVNGKKLLIFSQGGKVSTVAWRKSHAVYWIQNTLQNTIPNRQMIDMAATLTPYPSSLKYGIPKPKTHAKRHLSKG